ncbi:MAG: hypothetical protein ACFB9N_18380 [Geitlerinemataceae cyanobacterium]
MARSISSSRSIASTLGVLALALGACNSAAPPPQTQSAPATQDAPQAASTPLQSKVEVGTIQGLQQGDRACMADVTSSTGNVTQQFASSELCGQSQLVGQSLRLYYEPVTIAAASCQGNPDCTDSETVLSIVRTESLTAEAAPAPAAPAPQTPAAPPAPAPQAPAVPAEPEIPVAADTFPEAIYMGTASTGEEVYYEGMSFPCADLPADNSCWSSPVVSYRIGNDLVFAQTDCMQQTFVEVWVGGELVAENMSPQSTAISDIISMACYNANG